MCRGECCESRVCCGHSVVMASMPNKWDDVYSFEPHAAKIAPEIGGRITSRSLRSDGRANVLELSSPPQT